MHESAPIPHAAQAVPPMPQAVLEGAVQLDPWQHPSGQDVASQTHTPPAQLCPAAHGAPPPHRQAPLRHESAPVPQSRQAPPPTPHAEGAGAMHVAP